MEPERWAIIESLYLLDIHMNAAGYLFVAVVLFAIWAVNFFWFDRQTYMIFTPGQMKVCEKIGGGEQVYDTMGMNTQHLQDDFFRHRILGLGSGDLIVRTSGARTHEFHFNNVLFIKRTLAKIEQMQADRPIVKGGA